jgi:hypothetical protein
MSNKPKSGWLTGFTEEQWRLDYPEMAHTWGLKEHNEDHEGVCMCSECRSDLEMVIEFCEEMKQRDLEKERTV